MRHRSQNRISTNPEEAGLDTAMTETSIAIVILLNSMGTLIRALNPHLAMIIQIMKCISILPTKKRMEPEGGAEVEGGEKGIEA